MKIKIKFLLLVPLILNLDVDEIYMILICLKIFLFWAKISTVKRERKREDAALTILRRGSQCEIVCWTMFKMDKFRKMQDIF